MNSNGVAPVIDSKLAGHYRLTAEELDFPPRRASIINYDIKYRLGRDTEEGGE